MKRIKDVPIIRVFRKKTSTFPPVPPCKRGKKRYNDHHPGEKRGNKHERYRICARRDRGLPHRHAGDRRPLCEKQKLRGFLPRRTQARPRRNGYEHRGLGYERLPADGRAGPGDVLRRGGGQLDGDRPRSRHLSELAARGQTLAPLFRGDRRHHGAGLPRAALPRQEQDHRDGRRAGHHHFLRALHGLRLRGLRQAVQQPVRLRLHEGDAALRRGHRGLLRARRLHGGLGHEPDPVHRDDARAHHRALLRRQHRRRLGRRGGERAQHPRLSQPRRLDGHRFEIRRRVHADHGRVDAGLGPRLLRHAPHPAALHGRAR